jgi:hypothetical protein
MGKDICINCEANTHSSYANLGVSYKNENYEKGEKDSWMRFQGNPGNSHNFRVK